MAHGVLSSGIRRWVRLPIVGRIAVIYLFSRLVTTGFLLLAAQVSGPASRFGLRPDLRDFVLGWDAQWYWWVAENGYRQRCR